MHPARDRYRPVRHATGQFAALAIYVGGVRSEHAEAEVDCGQIREAPSRTPYRRATRSGHRPRLPDLLFSFAAHRPKNARQSSQQLPAITSPITIVAAIAYAREKPTCSESERSSK